MDCVIVAMYFVKDMSTKKALFYTLNKRGAEAWTHVPEALFEKSGFATSKFWFVRHGSISWGNNAIPRTVENYITINPLTLEQI